MPDKLIEEMGLTRQMAVAASESFRIGKMNAELIRNTNLPQNIRLLLTPVPAGSGNEGKAVDPLYRPEVPAGRKPEGDH